MESSDPAVRLRPAEPAPRPSLADDAYAALRVSILEASLPPGHTTGEGEIAEQLGMSRTPVHEAVLRLQQEGLLRVLPKRGVQVAPLSAEALAETYEVLVALEGAAARRLALDPGRAEVLRALSDATEAMAAALGARDLAAWARADDGFHRTLLDRCGNGRLARLANTVADQAQQARAATLRGRPLPTASADEHRWLLRALEAGEPETARAAVEAHRRRASAEILRALSALP